MALPLIWLFSENSSVFAAVGFPQLEVLVELGVDPMDLIMSTQLMILDK